MRLAPTPHGKGGWMTTPNGCAGWRDDDDGLRPTHDDLVEAEQAPWWAPDRDEQWDE